jgi:hypothetical protein
VPKTSALDRSAMLPRCEENILTGVKKQDVEALLKKRAVKI